jgi:hypothetical protein
MLENIISWSLIVVGNDNMKENDKKNNAQILQNEQKEPIRMIFGQ